MFHLEVHFAVPDLLGFGQKVESLDAEGVDLSGQL